MIVKIFLTILLGLIVLKLLVKVLAWYLSKEWHEDVKPITYITNMLVYVSAIASIWIWL